MMMMMMMMIIIIIIIITVRSVTSQKSGESLKSSTFCDKFLYQFYANLNKGIETTGNISPTVTDFTS
jgi:hypothetical protein